MPAPKGFKALVIPKASFLDGEVCRGNIRVEIQPYAKVTQHAYFTTPLCNLRLWLFGFCFRPSCI